MTREPGRTLTLTPSGLQSRERSYPKSDPDEQSFTTHLSFVGRPSIAGSAQGVSKRPIVAGWSLFAGAPIAGSVNAAIVEDGSSCAALAAGSVASAATATAVPRRALPHQLAIRTPVPSRPAGPALPRGGLGQTTRGAGGAPGGVACRSRRGAPGAGTAQASCRARRRR